MRKLSFIGILLSCWLILGCGSGGGGNNQTPDTESTNAKPVAVIKGNTNAKPGQLVELSGSDSSDADEDLLTYKWSLIFSPTGSKATLSSINTPDTSITPDIDGLYRIQLIVKDGTVDSNPATIEIIASTPNSAPIANAGPDQNVNTESIVSLDGSASSDPDGDTLAYQWSFVLLPTDSKAQLSKANNKNTTFVADIDGEYVIQLIVSDGEIESAPDEVKITASTPNSIPTAKAGTDRFILIGDTVILNGSESTDADQDPLSFRWFFVSKPEGSNASIEDAATVNPQLTPDIQGAYVVGLVVNDSFADSSQDNVTIQAFSEPLLATIYVNPSTIFQNGLTISGGDGSVIISGVLQANGKVYGDLKNQIDNRAYEVTAIMFLDSNRQIIALSSDSKVLNSNNIDPLEAISVNYTTPVNADVRGWIVLWQYKEQDGNIISVESKPLVYDWEMADNSPPVANAGLDQTVSVGSLVTLDGSSSNDADGDTLSYNWSIIFKPYGSTTTLSASNVVNPTFIADINGAYVVSLVVNDGNIDSTPDTLTITATLFNGVPPSVPTGLSLSTSVIDEANGESQITATWNANTETDLAYYELRVKVTNGGYVYFQSSNTTFTFSPVISGLTYCVGIQAKNTIGNWSGFTEDVCIESAKDTTAPQEPIITAFELPSGENAIYLLTSNFGGENEFVDISVVDFSHKGAPLLIFSLSANVAPTGNIFDSGKRSILFTTTDNLGFGPGGITYTGRLSFSGYTTINGENYRIATVVNFENSNSSYIRFRNMGNGIYRIEVDVYDVFGGTDGIDPSQDYDDLVFLIGPRSNLESFLGFVL